MIENNFDKFAENYREIHKKSLSKFSKMDFDYFIKYKLDIIREEISFTPKEILDFGCGIGLSSAYMAKLFPKTLITGIDTSEVSIQTCKNLCIKNSSFYNIDLTQEDNLLKKYDLIFAACVFHHIEPNNRQKVLKKLINSLNKNGKLFIFEHNPYNPVTSYIFKNSDIDKGCTMVSSKELKILTRDLKEPNIKIYPAKYTIFMPRYGFLEKIFFIEKYLKKLPIGCQYYTIIQKIA